MLNSEVVNTSVHVILCCYHEVTGTITVTKHVSHVSIVYVSICDDCILMCIGDMVENISS